MERMISQYDAGPPDDEVHHWGCVCDTCEQANDEQAEREFAEFIDRQFFQGD